MQQNLEEIEKKAKHLIQKYCPEYKFKWMNMKTTLGYCDYQNKTIAVSKFHAARNSEAVTKDTVIHEIAHALTPGHNHNKGWKAVCKSLGGTAEVCARIERTGHKWELKCVCGIYKYYRRPKNIGICGKCWSQFRLKKVSP